MAYTPRSSFTPGQTSSAIPVQIKKRRTIRVFGALSILMIVGSLMGTAGVFLYKEYAMKQLEGAKLSLQKESDVDNEKYIEEIRKYDRKLKIATYLLDTHIAPSNLFESLEGSTKQTVQFETLDFTYDPGFDATLVVGGVTKEFASLAQQKIQLDADGLFSDFVLHDIGLISEESIVDSSSEETVAPSESVGKIGFTVTGLFQKDLLLYTGENTQKELPITDVPEDTLIDETANLNEDADTSGNNLETTQI